MKINFKVLPLLISSLLFYPISEARADSSDPQVIPVVDLNRYAGRWYEIAHSPNFFQRNCARSTADYAVTSPSTLSVKNICYKDDGTTSDIEGVARIVDAATPAKLKVRFNFFARGDYWIIDLDPEYKWAIVSGPEKKSLFILARQGPMSQELLATLLTSLKNKGFKVEELIFDKY